MRESNTVKVSLAVRKEEISYLQQAEAILIRRASDAFQQRIEAFRSFFQKTAPFAVAEDRLHLDHVRHNIPFRSPLKTLAT
jgi:dynein heavy chain